MSSYPKRPPYFAQKYIRKLVKSCVANQYGQGVFTLLVAIASTEDAKRYRGAVTFHNGQLLPILGFGKWERLKAARQTAVDAGLLHYEPCAPGARLPGKYWVLEPKEFDGIHDSPVDDSDTNDTPKQDTKTGHCDEVQYPDSGYITGYAPGYGLGEPSILSPNSFPLNTSPGFTPDAQTAVARKPKKPKAPPAFTADDRAVADAIWRDIRSKYPETTPPNLDRWANDVRLMRERDHRTHDAMLALWQWAHADAFWSPNILSPAKLRDQWSKLAAKKGVSTNVRPNAPRQRAEYATVDRYAR